MDVWTVMRALHLFALAYFVGGQLLLATVVVPALRGQDESLMRGAAKRFGIGTAVALVILIATGTAMASHFNRWEETDLRIKLGLLALVLVLTGLHTVVPYRRALSASILLSSLAIVVFGAALAH